MVMRALFIVFFVVSVADSAAQQSELFAGIDSLTAWIASEKFETLADSLTPAETIDAIFLQAGSIKDGDTAEALLAATFAAVPYRVMPVVLPLSGIRLEYPLPSSDQERFEKKNANLPAQWLSDSPPGDFGDKDKLAHFFGSAWLAYAVPVFDLTRVIGYFLESFEEAFQADNAVDQRDIRVNNLGARFGNALRCNPDTLPSHIIAEDKFPD